MAKKRDQQEIFVNLTEARAFAELLRELRKARGLTQEDLALEAGVDRVTIARIETANQNVTLDTIITLSKALKVPPKALFDF